MPRDQDRCFRCRRFLDGRNSNVVRLLDTLVYASDDESDTAIEAFYDGRIIGTDADVFGVVLRPNDPGPYHICDWCHDTTGPTLHSYRWETNDDDACPHAQRRACGESNGTENVPTSRRNAKRLAANEMSIE